MVHTSLLWRILNEMFIINYKIIENYEDDYYGQNGFFQLVCNECTYGEIFLEEEEYMDQVDLDDWFKGILTVLETLSNYEDVFLSDIESYDTWIRFQKIQSSLAVSVVHAEKPIGTYGIECRLLNIKEGRWTNQIIEYEQFKKEVLQKTNMYIDDVLKHNECELIMQLKERVEHIT